MGDRFFKIVGKIASVKGFEKVISILKPDREESLELLIENGHLDLAIKYILRGWRPSYNYLLYMNSNNLLRILQAIYYVDPSFLPI